MERSPVKHYKLPRHLIDREEYILSLCKGKRVLHLGFADFTTTGHLARKVKSDQWLHKKIINVASEVIGIDNNTKAVKKLGEHYGITNIYVADAQKLDQLNMGSFDIIVAGEILEHLPCPGDFLKSAKNLLRDDSSIIVTTINAFCLRKMLRVVRGIESVHEDHVCYYSHRTIECLSQMFGYIIVDQYSYKITHKSPLMPYIVEKIASIISPNLCEGIIIRLQK